MTSNLQNQFWQIVFPNYLKTQTFWRFNLLFPYCSWRTNCWFCSFLPFWPKIFWYTFLQCCPLLMYSMYHCFHNKPSEPLNLTVVPLYMARISFWFLFWKSSEFGYFRRQLLLLCAFLGPTICHKPVKKFIFVRARCFIVSQLLALFELESTLHTWEYWLLADQDNF